MSNIKTFNDLREEKLRLEAILVTQKAAIRQDVADLREEMKPALSVLSFVGKAVGGSAHKTHPILSIALSLAGATLLKSRGLSATARLTQVIAPFLLTKASSYLSGKNGANIFSKLRDRWKKKSTAV